VQAGEHLYCRWRLRRVRHCPPLSGAWAALLAAQGGEAGASVRSRVCYDFGSTTLVTIQRCLPILRSRTNPSFS